ncbi:protein madd-4 isoform X2 [Uranotaenia lowii]|uniref:protein madd-4 isoform X2 n=1 Tax=Uranotaenia lowii TaxID=190385 RepID=UPI002479ECBB|nr:protein madd-4 isoform X2 [Uranotaenia lowii]
MDGFSINNQLKNGRQSKLIKMDFKEILLLLCLLLTLARASHKDSNSNKNSKSLNETLSSWAPSDADPEDEDDEEVQVSKRAKAQGWSSWTEWSTCSRSCDGGVAYQLRRCHAPHGCKGDAVRYKICNMQPCPEQQDFRAHQCSAYDDVPYDGALLKWTPHYDYSEPCALTCRGRPQHLLEDMPDSAAASESFPPVVGDDEPSVIVQLSNRVQDGTRCRPGSLDMCIQGKCQRVGCDLKIGSTKKIDVCGVCGGDGTSCTQPLYQWEIAPMSLCSVTCGGGYKMAMPTCRNRVTGVDVEESLCNASSRPEPTVVQCNTHLCPPKWVTDDWRPCSKACGGGVRERVVVCAEESNGAKNKVPDEACRGVRPKSQETCNVQECPKWVSGEWSGCSVSCGSGIQIRSVQCIDSGGHFSNLCDHKSKPSTGQQCTTGIGCNGDLLSSSPGLASIIVPGSITSGSSGASGSNNGTDEGHDYPQEPAVHVGKEKFSAHHVERDPTLMTYNDQPYYAQPLRQERLTKSEKVLSPRVPSEATFIQDTEWSPCSVTCGEGIRRKPFRCKIFLEFSKRVAILNDSLCHAYKPLDEVERCVMEPCSYPPNFEESYLKDGNRQNLDGIKVAAAVPGKTYSWREEGYTSCSASCLGGVEELIINCVRDDTGKIVSPFLCSPETKPEARIRTCNDIPCPPRWNYSEFTPCSKSCGFGIQTREVTCIHEVTRGGENTMIVPNSMCTTKPQPDRQYCNIIDCPVRWEVSEWSKCSKPCGGGIKERRVECKQIMAQEHKVERPATMCPSSKPPDKKPCNSKACAPEDQRPPIAGTNSTFIQHDPKKNKITLKIGGAATVFFGTQIKIKCPVKRFNRTKIRWSKDQTPLTKSRKIKISKKGALRILDVTFKENGIYTCHAGLSHADLKLTVKPKPGLSENQSEDSGRHRDGGDLNALRDHSYVASQSGTDEKGGRRNREKIRGKNRQRPSADTVQNAESSVMEDELMRSHSQMTASDSTVASDAVSAASSGSRTMPMPHFQHLLASLQFLWPFQTFTNSKGHQWLMEQELGYLGTEIGELAEQAEQDEPMRPPSVINVYELLKNARGSRESGQHQLDSQNTTNGTDGHTEAIEFEWMTTPWSECSQTCGANGSGYRLRSVHCMVKLINSSHTVDNGLCEDAGLPIPETVEKCGNIECPRWISTEWTLCLQSKCFAWHTALQKREVFCKFGNESNSDRCEETERPVTKQECYNEMCKGVWRVEPWSECNAACSSQGIKYRILQCVWYGTKKPAGNACKDQPRPAVMKVCKGPPCISSLSDCKDSSRYCKNVKTMGLCRLHRYQQQCCRTCRFNIYN